MIVVRRPVLLTLVYVFLLAACSPPPPEGVAENEHAQRVKVIKVEQRAVPVSEVFSGRAEGSKEVEVRARVEGILLRRAYVEGEKVEAGQLLYEIDAAPFEVALSRAEAQLAQAKATLSAAQRRWDRSTELIRKNAISQRDRDDAQSELEMARASVQLAQAEVRAAQISLDYCKVRAPISGITSRERVSEGSLVGPNNNVLTTITQLDPIWVNMSLPDQIVILLRRMIKQGELAYDASQRGLKIETDVGEFHPYRGQVSFSDSAIDRRTGTIQYRATVPNPDGGLIPGQFLRVHFMGLYSADSIAIPERAILQDASGSFVYVVDAERRAKPRPVVVGLEVEGGLIIESGLNEGDRVVVDGMVRIRPGSLLDYEEVPGLTFASQPTAAGEAALTASVDSVNGPFVAKGTAQ